MQDTGLDFGHTHTLKGAFLLCLSQCNFWKNIKRPEIRTNVNCLPCFIAAMLMNNWQMRKNRVSLHNSAAVSNFEICTHEITGSKCCFFITLRRRKIQIKNILDLVVEQRRLSKFHELLILLARQSVGVGRLFLDDLVLIFCA